MGMRLLGGFCICTEAWKPRLAENEYSYYYYNPMRKFSDEISKNYSGREGNCPVPVTHVLSEPMLFVSVMCVCVEV